jgi:CPA2 family monovalent cation:H+ antiporter-2
MDIMMAVTAITMTITPLFLLLNERIIDPRFGNKRPEGERPADEINEKNQVIIAGFGHFGSTIGRFLRANGVETTILDHDSGRVDLLRKMGFKVYYGDATRLDLLRAAGAESASILIAAIDPPESNQELIRIAQRHFPQLKIMARSRSRMDAYDLVDMGIKNIYRESLDTSVRMATDVLSLLGRRRYNAIRQGQKFIKYDEQTILEMASHRHDMKQYISKAREMFKEQEELLSMDQEIENQLVENAWDSETIRETISRSK